MTGSFKPPKEFGGGTTTNTANMNMYVTITGGDPKETEFAVKKALLGGYQVVQASQAKGKAEKK